MKTLKLIAAAAVAMIAIPATASAAPVSAPSTVVSATALASSAQVRVVVRENRGRNYQRGRYNRRAATRRVCTNRWRNGQRTRVCRTVRYRR